MLANGRQVIFDFKLAGDVACLRNVLLDKPCRNLKASTDAVVSLVQHGELRALIEESEAVRQVFLDKLDEECVHLNDRFTRLARTNALERTASFILDIWTRLRAAGQAPNMSFPLMITQDDLADALGLTPVHVNRTLRQLKLMGVLTITCGIAVIRDLDTLQSLARI